MLTIDQNIFLRICELPNGPRPLPLESGFNAHTSYRALGMFNPSETSDAYFILSNDRDEIWFICNRHLRTVCNVVNDQAYRIPLGTTDSNGTTGLAYSKGEKIITHIRVKNKHNNEYNNVANNLAPIST